MFVAQQLPCISHKLSGQLSQHARLIIPGILHKIAGISRGDLREIPKLLDGEKCEEFVTRMLECCGKVSGFSLICHVIRVVETVELDTFFSSFTASLDTLFLTPSSTTHLFYDFKFSESRQVINFVLQTDSAIYNQ